MEGDSGMDENGLDLRLMPWKLLPGNADKYWYNGGEIVSNFDVRLIYWSSVVAALIGFAFGFIVGALRYD